MTNWEELQTDPTILNQNIMDKRRSLSQFVSSTLTKDKNRIIDNITQRKKSDFSKLNKFDDSFSGKLSVTGGDQEIEISHRVPDKGIIKLIIIDFPIGSHYAFRIDIFVDNAPIFENLRGNASLKTFSDLSNPVSKQSVVKFRMRSDSTVVATAKLSAYVDMVVEMDKK